MHGVAVAGWTVDTNPRVERTLDRMAKYAREAMGNASLIQYANEIIAGTRPRDTAAQISAIEQFVKTWFHFVDNPVGAQVIRDPASIVADIEARGFTQGACDDAAVLVATLGMANGIEARYRALAFGTRPTDTDRPFTHVIADLWDGHGWQALDVTKPERMAHRPLVVATLTREIEP